MRRIISTIVLAGFLLISAMANLSNSYASHGIVDAAMHKSASEQGISDLSASSVDLTTDGDKVEAEKEKCSCKEKSGPATFVCGVVLALSNPSTQNYLPIVLKERFVFVQTASPPSIVDSLKKPPRTTF